VSSSKAPSGSVWHKPQGATSWTVPSLDEFANGRRATDVPSQDVDAPPEPPTAAEIEAIQTAAHDEGFSRGHAEGLAAGRAQAEHERQVLVVLASQLTRPLAELDNEVERALVNLALSMARRIVGKAVTDDPENLRTLVHRVVSHLGKLESTVEVELCPEDYERLNALDNLDSLWSLRSNPELQPADVVVRQADTEVDGRLSGRIESLAADMLDGG